MNPEKKENRCQVSGLPPFIASREFPCCSVGRETHTKPGTLRWGDGTETGQTEAAGVHQNRQCTKEKTAHRNWKICRGPPQVFRGISTSVWGNYMRPQGRINERVSSTHTGLGIVPVPTARLEKLKSHRSRARYSKSCCLSRGNISPTLKNSPGFTSDLLKAKPERIEL